jgi:PKD repeat protein
MVQARPDFTPAMIRQAIMETADNASNPDNTYGSGLVDLWGAIGWGANFWADTLIGDAPLSVQFFDSATVNPTAWDWSFGDGGVSTLQNPSHEYTTPGAYDVSLTVQSSLG